MFRSRSPMRSYWGRHQSTGGGRPGTASRMIRGVLTRRDGAAARARWTLACEVADREIRAARELAGHRDEPWVDKGLSVEAAACQPAGQGDREAAATGYRELRPSASRAGEQRLVL